MIISADLIPRHIIFLAFDNSEKNYFLRIFFQYELLCRRKYKFLILPENVSMKKAEICVNIYAMFR